MAKDSFDIPDMGDLARQMEDAMAEAQKAMADLPSQVEGLDDVMGSLSSLMGGLSGDTPAQMEELTGAMAGFGEQHAANVTSLAGEPDWSVVAEIRVGNKLHIRVDAAFDLAKVRETWASTQGAGFESLVAGVAAQSGESLDEDTLGQVMGQLKKGRSIAVVRDVKVLACQIQGAPKNATETLQLSPEGNIPLVMDEGRLGFEFAPLLTIRNQWENASIPTFTPMGEEIMVPLAHFESGEAFQLEFEPAGQDDALTVTLSFQILEV